MRCLHERRTRRGPTGNLTSASEPNGRQVTWSFDGIYRLTNEQITGDPNSQNNGTVSYIGLDPVGNRLSDTSSLAGVPSGSWSYNQDDQLSGETYDQDGNVTAANGKTFSYDSQNQMLSMNGGAVQMLYDGDGNRVAKSVTSGGVTTTTYFLVDDLNPTGLPQVVDELTNGVVTRTYTYGLQRISEDQLVSNVWTPSFYSYDGMGSVRQLTNAAGAVTDTYEYDAFGNQISHTGSTLNNYLYRGEQWDPDLGLYYLRARYYNPNTGRFMSRDPLNGNRRSPASLHKYIYARGNPVNRIDPSGRADEVEYPHALMIALAVATTAYVLQWDISHHVFDNIAHLLGGLPLFSGSGSGGRGRGGAGPGEGAGEPGSPPPPNYPHGCGGPGSTCRTSNGSPVDSWQAAEQWLNEQFGGQPQAPLNLEDGQIIEVDNLTPERIGQEAKFGQQSLNEEMEQQIQNYMEAWGDGLWAPVLVFHESRRWYSIPTPPQLSLQSRDRGLCRWRSMSTVAACWPELERKFLVEGGGIGRRDLSNFGCAGEHSGAWPRRRSVPGRC